SPTHSCVARCRQARARRNPGAAPPRARYWLPPAPPSPHRVRPRPTLPLRMAAVRAVRAPHARPGPRHGTDPALNALSEKACARHRRRRPAVVQRRTRHSPGRVWPSLLLRFALHHSDPRRRWPPATRFVHATTRNRGSKASRTASAKTFAARTNANMKPNAALSDHHTTGSRASSKRALLIILPQDSMLG